MVFMPRIYKSTNTFFFSILLLILHAYQVIMSIEWKEKNLQVKKHIIRRKVITLLFCVLWLAVLNIYIEGFKLLYQ